MTDAHATPVVEAVTALVLDLFRVNNLALNSGDRLVAEIGLTSARWQVLGSIVAAERPQPVARLARDMGTNRQNVQRIVNDLEKEGSIEFQPNPHHRRAQLVVLTDKGRQTFEAAMARQGPWAERLAQGLDASTIVSAHRVLLALKQNLTRHG
ncbi:MULTISPECIES: MarR family transcriptional regulator [unclassified Novosphingobium]|uniref:MarR family winged helix-turn-helix transcriptional regulator n=1 Tax=unclassified Novosphingobium TaxID=2644732 RepID=UPI0014472F1A|nr:MULTISPECIES: MarR family transcriptional regulator [unclassified Novosphingobium]NKJ44875.1 DNA-binding MarR family transcriptional regulator [Novosphingobium sp. SG720]NMN07476.1 DNA-binding MarR family transcriptional regulator [Novosphingobium sp. SG919]NMN89739.1 DNA-binding MarR family transcriptional regulator [Novosphingobium sp. SG916]